MYSVPNNEAQQMAEAMARYQNAASEGLTLLRRRLHDQGPIRWLPDRGYAWTCKSFCFSLSILGLLDQHEYDVRNVFLSAYFRELPIYS